MTSVWVCEAKIGWRLGRNKNDLYQTSISKLLVFYSRCLTWTFPPPEGKQSLGLLSPILPVLTPSPFCFSASSSHQREQIGACQSSTVSPFNSPTVSDWLPPRLHCWALIFNPPQSCVNVIIKGAVLVYSVQSRFAPIEQTGPFIPPSPPANFSMNFCLKDSNWPFTGQMWCFSSLTHQKPAVHSFPEKVKGKSILIFSLNSDKISLPSTRLHPLTEGPKGETPTSTTFPQTHNSRHSAVWSEGARSVPQGCLPACLTS